MFDATCPKCGGHSFTPMFSGGWLRRDEDHPDRAHMFVTLRCTCGGEIRNEIKAGICAGGWFPLVEIRGRWYNAHDV